LSDDPGTQTVLIVDDEATNVQALARLLKEDCRIQVANNGERALEIAAEHRPDLILLDIQMPGIDGHEVCRRLKNDDRTSGIPVIFVTAADSVSEEEKGFRLGAVDYISKPFYPVIVRARVRNHLDLKRKTDELERLSMRDGLTGIPNRRHFTEVFGRERRRALTDGAPLSVVMMDIDHFKAFNDHYGHAEGDACLQRVARALATATKRGADLVARYGGEEFVALLPDTDAEGAAMVAERFRGAVEALQVPHGHSPTAEVVTLSVGAATLEEGSDRDAAQHLLRRADEALYGAKRGGRNRVVRAA